MLIGSADSGLSGLPWETWGHVSKHIPNGFSPDELAGLDRNDPKSRTLLSMQAAYEADARGEVAPYAADGFGRATVTSCSEVQLCRRDTSVASRHSETAAFWRRQDAGGVLPPPS